MNWPTTWFNVKTALEQMPDHYIDYNKFTTICQDNQVTKESAQKTLVEYLNNLGIILHFTDFRLKNTQVLEPKWVTKAVYKIINSRQVTDRQGILHLNDLEAILKQEVDEDYYYPSDQHPYIVDLMHKFELCYYLDDNQVLIPDLLPVEEPNFEFEPALQFRIDYEFLPRSIIPRFIVNMHEDIKDELRWRTGVVLRDQEFAASALIKSDDEARKIFISVNGKQRRDYFATILKTLIKIHSSFEVEKLGIDERVCLPDNPKLTVSLKHLYSLENREKKDYSPEGSERDYLVSELLGTVGIKDKDILSYVKEIHASHQESNTEKATETFLLQPNIFGIGFNLNSLFKWFLKFHKK
ncbi:COR domain-containing protein [Candidatus Halobeggiatoa sp. HSG11]|nr:COR domain-containing protein [Candidatus Halobeggiatoa sp. HSG11]